MYNLKYLGVFFFFFGVCVRQINNYKTLQIYFIFFYVHYRYLLLFLMGHVIVYRYQHNIFNKLICLKCLGLKSKVFFPPYFGWNYVAHNCIILTQKNNNKKSEKNCIILHWYSQLNVGWPQPIKECFSKKKKKINYLCILKCHTCILGHN